MLFSALTDLLKRDIKTIDLPGFERVQATLGKLAQDHPKWFPEGFNGIQAVANPELFAALDAGKLYFSNADELVPGFQPAKLLAQALEKIGKNEALDFSEEYAVETLWHELMHGMTGIRAVKTEIGKEPLEEGLIQMVSRFSYPELLRVLGSDASHQEAILKNGYSYPKTARNWLEMLIRAGLDGNAVAQLLREDGVNWKPRLMEWLSKGLNIRQDRIATLFGHVEGKSLQDFIAKIGVLIRNAPRNNPA